MSVTTKIPKGKPMAHTRSALGALVVAVFLTVISMATGSAADDGFVTVNRFVPHTSTVPANAGQRVGIFLHEKVSRQTLAAIEQGERPEGRVVLFVHGGSVQV